MEKRFHGIDLHKRYATIMIRDEEGSEIKHISKCTDFRGYVEALAVGDMVVIESINNAFYWADQVEKQGATCYIVDPHRFKIIKDSWNKTDKRDAANLSLALRMAEMRSEFKMPTVYKPSSHIRELRKLFSQYQMITEQIQQYKTVFKPFSLKTELPSAKNRKINFLIRKGLTRSATHSISQKHHDGV